ncbi:2-dehydro-3-deoxy-6-phosphogalactonate aldolase [Martelella mangrovi]|uniref:2-dehydro-3-deoxyphosphogalactonate aldolase n=1 Tax=Martelella mangrovi TaxID=1397477 RepID=A0ABV2IDX0_9HYPH
MSEETLVNRFESAFSALPLVAILRGLKPEESVDAVKALYDEGFRLIEIPLNSPDPFASIEAARKALPADALVGAGTVVKLEYVGGLVRAGADLVVMPHADVEIIRAARAAGMICVPGFATPTEAFAALAAGANALKIFPAELMTPKIVKAMRTVLPKEARLLPVGGIRPDNMTEFLDAGAAGFGLGSALYKPGDSVATLAEHARDFVTAISQRTGQV